MQDINFRNESSNLINFILPKADTITIDKLNEIYDNFFLEKSSTSSTNYLLNVLQLLENVDKTILMKPFMLNNEFNSYLIDKLYHLLKKFYKINYLNDQEYLLYHYLIKYFFRLEFNPQKFLRPIEKLLNIYSKDQTFFSNENYVKDFSKILSLFIQNQTIMTSIIKCLTNRYYIQSLENISHDYFILISCPSYWILYTGPNREEFSNRLLHSLLIPSCRIFAENSWKNSSKSLNLLIDVLNYSFVKCNVHLLINDDLLFLIDSILILLTNERILKDKRSIIKSLIRLILTLLSKYEFLLKYVKQRQEIFYKLINIENDIYLILAFIMNNHQIKNILNHNENFALVLREYVNQLNKQQFYQNDFLTKRLKFLLEETIQNKGESKNPIKENVQSNNRIPPNPIKSALEFDNNQQNLINSDVVSQEFNGIRVMESLTKHQDNLLSDGLQAPVRIQPEQNQNGHRQTDTNWIVSDTVTSLKNTQPEQMRNKHYQSDLNWIGSETGKNLINSQPEKVRNKHYHSDSNWISSETGKNLTNSKPEKIRSEHHQPDSNRILSETVQTLTNTQTEPTRSKHRQSDPNRIVTDTATIMTNTQPESTRSKHRQSDSKRIVSDTGKNLTNSQPQQHSHNGHPQSDSSWNGTETKKSVTNSQPEPVRGGHHQSDSNRIVSETVKHLTNSQPEQIRNGHQQSEPNSVRLETLTNSTNSQSETIRSRHRQPDSSSIVSETIKNQENNQPEHIRSGDQQTDFNSIVSDTVKNFEKNQPEQIHSEHYQPDSNWIGLETGKNLANSQLEQVNGGHHQSDVDWLLSETVKSLTNYQPEQNHNGHHQLDSNWILSAPLKTMTNNQPEQIHNKHHQSDSNSIVPQTVQVHNVSYQSDLDWIVSETMKNPMNSQLEEIPNGNNQMDWNWIVSETVKNLTNNHQSEEMHSGFNERDFNKIIKETMIQSGQQEPDEVFDSDSNHALTEITINPRKITSEQINNELEKSKSNEIFNKNGHELDIQEMSVEIPLDYIIFSNSNKNEEEIVLIWYDNNISKTVDMNKTIESLQQINDYVFICSNQQVFLKYIREIKKEKIFLILSESTIDEILNEIHNYEQIYSIFLCSVKPIKYEQYLNNEQLNKIIGIYTDFQSLLISIYENVQYEIKQIEIESLFYEKEQTIEDLNEFQSITIFKEILLNNSFDKNEELNQIIEECQKYYKTNKKELINIDDFKRNYKSEDAIQWYIKQTFIYRLINKALKYENYQILLIFKIFIKDLCENIQKKFQLFKLKQNSNSVLSYSGLFLSNPRLENLKQNIGKILTTNTFFFFS
ncbi:unnamed protein product [Adineta steineri]|uniref:Uncharacterized protein n=1 Tax=Adineta steineri TaxID=433720 RepID=A0A818XIU9_9BILA|nr:unnamed protein product [Adineta steineri]CAF3737694.1 unnamed protein product [Adineta steineri]